MGVDPNNPENLVITLGNYGDTSYVLVSSTAASDTDAFSFTSIQANLPAMPCYDAIIEMEDSNTIIVGTEYGVWATDNAWSGNVTWTNENNSFPRVPTFMVVQQTLPNNNCTGVTVSGNIYVATHGRGIWRTEEYAKPLDTVVCGLPIGISEANDRGAFTMRLDLYPNPIVNGKTVVTYTLGGRADVQVALYDITGKQLSTYTLNQQSGGKHTMDLDCNGMKAGTYLVSVISNGLRRTKRLVIL